MSIVRSLGAFVFPCFMQLTAFFIFFLYDEFRYTRLGTRKYESHQKQKKSKLLNLKQKV